MSPGFVKFLALLGFILVCIFCLICNTGKIENDLKVRSVQALDGINLKIDRLILDGRNVTLNGLVKSEQEKSRAEKLIADVYGIRTVINYLEVKKEEPKEVVVPPPTQEKLDLTTLLKDVRIGFELNSTQLDREARITLDKVAEIMKKARQIRITINGHTDNIGNANNNMILSQKRATSVLEYLVSKGVERNFLIAKGFGETQSITENSTAEGRRKNRRIEFQIMEVN
jgi:outer membrane protein OmpA-like peptidoglycan-associated protein